MAVLLSSPYVGTIELGSRKIRCAVLNYNAADPLRVFDYREIIGTLTQNKNGNLDKYLQSQYLRPYLPTRLLKGPGAILTCRLENKKVKAISAGHIVDICKAYRDASRAGALHHKQNHLAEMAEIMLFAFTQNGVNKIIDEATGYQDMRMKNTLEDIFSKMLPFYSGKNNLTSPIELYKQWFRLNNWEWSPETAERKPGILSKWTQDLVYERLSPELRNHINRTPAGPDSSRNIRQHPSQEPDLPALREFYGGLIALARATANWRKYYDLVNRAYPKYDQPSPDDNVQDGPEVELLSFY